MTSARSSQDSAEPTPFGVGGIVCLALMGPSIILNVAVILQIFFTSEIPGVGLLDICAVTGLFHIFIVAYCWKQKKSGMFTIALCVYFAPALILLLREHPGFTPYQFTGLFFGLPLLLDAVLIWLAWRTNHPR